MDSFNQQHLANIKAAFSRQSGVQLPQRRPARLPRLLRPAALLLACFCCLLAAPAVADTLFSPLDGDDLALSSSYLGDGLVSISVENRSQKQLQLQPQLRLRQWNSGEEVAGDANAVTFSETLIPAGESRDITIDLSAAYDVAQLEQPLSDDHYYLVLTNNNFIFGNDWLCLVDFAAAPLAAAQPDNSHTAPGGVDAAVIAGIAPELHFYFQAQLLDSAARRELQAQYVTAYTQLIDNAAAPVVGSYSPVSAPNRIDTSLPYLTVAAPAEGVIFDSSWQQEQSQLIGLHWQSSDHAKHLLATEGEYALVLSGAVADKKYQDALTSVPLFYLFTYEKAAIENDSNLAFIYGQLYSFAELAPYQIYADEQLVMYEVSPLIYSDLGTHAANVLGGEALSAADLQVLQNIYDHYRTELPQLIEYKQLD